MYFTHNGMSSIKIMLYLVLSVVTSRLAPFATTQLWYSSAVNANTDILKLYTTV